MCYRHFADVPIDLLAAPRDSRANAGYLAERAGRLIHAGIDGGGCPGRAGLPGNVHGACARARAPRHWTRHVPEARCCAAWPARCQVFRLPDSQGVMRGLDADTCRAVTAAALGDAAKTKFVPTTTQNRFTALQSGEVDLLSRSTTWTLTREGNLGLEFAWVNYYDGTGFLVKTASGVKSAKEMDGATHLRAAGQHDGTRDQRFLPAAQHEVHPDPDRRPRGNSGRVPVRPLRRLFHRCLGAGDVPLQPGPQGRRTCCCCPTSSVRSRLASWSARATTNGSISCAGPSRR